jgi:hypothetical protein
VPLIDIVSDDWDCTRRKAGDPLVYTPWKELDVFSNYVYDLVYWANIFGHVDYWEVMNEPGGWPFSGGTVADYLAVHKAAFQAIRAADPTAKVVGPAISSFVDTNRWSGELDLTSFMDYAQANNLDFAAISWHEISNAFPGAQHALQSPDQAATHVATVRSMLAAHPVLSAAKIFVDEYSPPDNRLIPGWAVGFISSLERANVDQGGRICWGLHVECLGGLDGILAPDTVTPQALYWVYAYYGQMKGTRIPTTTSASDITGFSTRDDVAQTVKILLGRHVNCAPAPFPNATALQPLDPCPQAAPSTAAKSTVKTTVKIPYALTRVRIHVERIPNARGPMTATTVVSDTVQAVSKHAVSVSLPSFADGDAYTVTVSPA